MQIGIRILAAVGKLLLPRRSRQLSTQQTICGSVKYYSQLICSMSMERNTGSNDCGYLVGDRTEGALQADCLLLPGYLSILSRWMLNSLFLLRSPFFQGQSLSMILLDAASPL